MELSADQIPAFKYKVFDVETNKEIEFVTKANDKTGEYTQVVTNRGKVEVDINGNVVTEKKIGQIKFVKIS